MLSRNFEEYPEHRQRFYQLLKAVVNSAFEVSAAQPDPSAISTGFSSLSCSPFHVPWPSLQAILHIDPVHQKLVVDSIVWGFKHTDRNISEIGLEILHDLLMVQHIQPPARQATVAHLTS